jgi:hypothetical protein
MQPCSSFRLALCSPISYVGFYNSLFLILFGFLCNPVGDFLVGRVLCNPSYFHWHYAAPFFPLYHGVLCNPFHPVIGISFAITGYYTLFHILLTLCCLPLMAGRMHLVTPYYYFLFSWNAAWDCPSSTIHHAPLAFYLCTGTMEPLIVIQANHLIWCSSTQYHSLFVLLKRSYTIRSLGIASFVHPLSGFQRPYCDLRYAVCSHITPWLGYGDSMHSFCHHVTILSNDLGFLSIFSLMDTFIYVFSNSRCATEIILHTSIFHNNTRLIITKL